jgi:hypothetical protein
LIPNDLKPSVWENDKVLENKHAKTKKVYLMFMAFLLMLLTTLTGFKPEGLIFVGHWIISHWIIGYWVIGHWIIGGD